MDKQQGSHFLTVSPGHGTKNLVQTSRERLKIVNNWNTLRMYRILNTVKSRMFLTTCVMYFKVLICSCTNLFFCISKLIPPVYFLFPRPHQLFDFEIFGNLIKSLYTHDFSLRKKNEGPLFVISSSVSIIVIWWKVPYISWQKGCYVNHILVQSIVNCNTLTFPIVYSMIMCTYLYTLCCKVV